MNDTDPTESAVVADPVQPVVDRDIVDDDLFDPDLIPGDRDGPVRRQNRVAIIGTAILLVALAFGVGFAAGRVTAPGPSDGSTAVLDPSPSVVDPSAPVASTTPSTGPDLPSDGNRLGRADAKVVIDYWADYQCPFCSKFAEDVIPQLAPRIADGTVALVHRDYAFIGPESIDAAIAVRCAGREGKFWPMHDAVYAAQKGENQGAFARDKLIAVGVSIGLDADALKTCMDDRSVMLDVLDDTAAGVRTAIASTPTVDINGTRFLGVSDMPKLNAAIDAAVAGASPAPLPTQAPVNDPWSSAKTSGREAGDTAAPVTVELWMDYQAKDSATLPTGLEPELRSRAADGKIRVVLRDLALLGDESVTAAASVRCTADQDGPAWLVHDILASAAQGANAGIFVPDNVLRLAVQLGLQVRTFDACLAAPATTSAITSETADGKAAGLTAGPAVVVSAGGKEIARFEGPIDTAKVLKAIDGAG